MTVQIFYTKASGHQNVGITDTKTDQDGQYYLEYDGPYLIVDDSSEVVRYVPIQLEASKRGYSSWASGITRTEEIQTIDFQLTPNY